MMQKVQELMRVGVLHRPGFKWAILALLLAGHSADAATLGFSPATGASPVGQPFVVKVVIDTAGEAMRGATAGGSVAFDPTMLTAVSVAKDPAFNLCTPDPTPDNGAGSVTFGCGTTGTASGQAGVFSVTFKGKKEGVTKITFKNPQLLVAGASKLTGSGEVSYTITAAAAPQPATQQSAPVQQPTRTVNITPPEAPVFKSTSHPDQTKWYKGNAGKVSWDIPYGVTGMKIGFSGSATTGPSELHEPPTSDWSKEAVADGVWFFSGMYKNRGGWGSTTVYKLQVDTTPPEPFTVSAQGGDLTAQIRFEVHDTLSGVTVYRIGVDAGRSRDVQPTEVADGSYTITNMDPGEHKIAVTAVDAAGNERSADATVIVTGTKQNETPQVPVETSGFGTIYWISLFFVAALAIVITMLIQERRRFHEEKDQIKRETMEAGDKLINVFSVLRDEMEERVLELSHKPNMTDNERTILESLKDALDISEELIDKEIEDVRKLLK